MHTAGLRSYNPVLGRWINRDPIGEQGATNLMGFVGNSPLGALDFIGMWEATADSAGKARRIYKWEKGDTIGNLASLLGLDLADIRKWARPVGNKMVDYKTPCKVSVPNTIWIHVGEYRFNYLLKIFEVWAEKIAKRYKARGYNVIGPINPTSSTRIKTTLHSKNIYGFLYFGHGLDGHPGTLQPAKNDIVYPKRYTRYKIRFMVLYGCATIGEAPNPPREIGLSDPSKTYWNSNVSSKGRVVGFTTPVSLLKPTDTIFLNPPSVVEGTTSVLAPNLDARPDDAK